MKQLTFLFLLSGLIMFSCSKDIDTSTDSIEDITSDKRSTPDCDDLFISATETSGTSAGCCVFSVFATANNYEDFTEPLTITVNGEVYIFDPGPGGTMEIPSLRLCNGENLEYNWNIGTVSCTKEYSSCAIDCSCDNTIIDAQQIGYDENGCCIVRVGGAIIDDALNEDNCHAVMYIDGTPYLYNYNAGANFRFVTVCPGDFFEYYFVVEGNVCEKKRFECN